MLHAIGIAGEVPRIFYGSSDPADIELMLRPGEVAVPVGDYVSGRIAADGGSIEAADSAIADLRAALWQRAKDVRFAREAGGVDVAGIGRVQTGTVPPFDGESRIAIEASRAARALAAGQPWSIDFKLADNSRRTVSAAEMIAIDDAVSAHIQTCRANAEAIRALIAAAPDEAALAAIDISGGYPPMPA